MRRGLLMAYSIAAYAFFQVTMLYCIGFIGGFLTPTTLDGPRQGSLPLALAVDLGLLVMFAVQHSGMARPRFKEWWTRIVPESAERCTYVLISSLALLAVFWFWRPLGVVIWSVDSRLGRVILYGLFGGGLILVFLSTFLINHLDLFGLRQAWLHYRGQPYTRLPFETPFLYRLVRHPLYVGWLFTFWATPHMTLAHLVFAAGLTAYILAAIRWEERDLLSVHPEYSAYREQVPMLIPRRRSAIPHAGFQPIRSEVSRGLDLDASRVS